MGTLQLPLPPGLEVSAHPCYGNVLVATRHFSPGEPVILEDPLLFTDEEDESGTCDLVYEAHQQFGIRALVDGRDASLDFGQQILAYLVAPPHIRELVRLMCSPSKTECVHREYIEATQHYTHTLQRLYNDPAVRSQLEHSVLAPAAAACATIQGAQDMATLLLVWACNAYAWVNSGCAVLAGGSLVTHSCRENTRFHVWEDGPGARALLARATATATAATAIATAGPTSTTAAAAVATATVSHCEPRGPPRGCFLAVTHIPPGDLITTTYLGYGVFRIMSTRMRRAVLRQTKMFTCTCARCMDEPDWFGALPCPTCNPTPAAVPLIPAHTSIDMQQQQGQRHHLRPGADHHLDGSPMAVGVQQHLPQPSQSACCRGYIVRDGRAATAHADTPWKCDGCGTRFSQAQVASSLAVRAQAVQLHASLLKPSTKGSTPLSLSSTLSQPAPTASAVPCRQQPVPCTTKGSAGDSGCLSDTAAAQLQAVALPPCSPLTARETVCVEEQPTAGQSRVLELSGLVLEEGASDGLQLDAHMEARVHNLNSMLAAGVQVTAAELLAARQEALALYGHRHWTVHALGLGLIEVLADELVEACHAHLDEWADQQHGSRLQQPAQHQLSGDSQGEQQAEPHQHCTHTSHDLTLQGPELTPVVAGEGGEQSAQPAAAGLPEPFGSDTDGPGSSVGSDAEAASQTMGVPSQAAALQPQQLVSLLCTLLDDTWHYLSHHTTEDAAAVMKAALGPATTALLAAAESGLLDSSEDGGQDEPGRTVQVGASATAPMDEEKTRTQRSQTKAPIALASAVAGGTAPHNSVVSAEAAATSRDAQTAGAVPAGAGCDLYFRALQVAQQYSHELGAMYCLRPWLDLCSSAGAEAARVAARCEQLLN